MTFSLQLTADQLALCGAIIAAASLVISLLSFLVAYLTYRRDRSNITVQISQGFLAYRTSLSEPVVFVTAMNTGRRTVTLNSAGLALSSGDNMAFIRPLGDTLPCELQEGRSIQIYMDKAELIAEVRRTGKKVLHAWYGSATGEKFRSSRRNANAVINKSVQLGEYGRG